MPRLALLDPSLKDHTGAPSHNLGDLIIYDSVKKVIDEIFSHWEVDRFATHSPYRDSDCSKINKSDVVILGGTNALCSYRGGASWYYPHEGWFFLFPRIRQNILLGVGWGTGYPDRPSKHMAIFYHRILSKKWLHSVRDDFTRANLAAIGIRNVINTGCPTLWRIKNFRNLRRNPAADNCLFTLTDYAKEPVLDNRLIQLLAESVSGRLVFFPQGDEDLEYINALAAYDRYKSRIEILDRNFSSLKSLVATQNSFFYVGTRLHCGIFCLQHGWDALILEVDNRAKEMAKDFCLPVLQRTNISQIEPWIKGALDLGTMRLPLDNIRRWKEQFKTIAPAPSNLDRT